MIEMADATFESFEIVIAAAWVQQKALITDSLNLYNEFKQNPGDKTNLFECHKKISEAITLVTAMDDIFYRDQIFPNVSEEDREAFCQQIEILNAERLKLEAELKK